MRFFLPVVLFFSTLSVAQTQEKIPPAKTGLDAVLDASSLVTDIGTIQASVILVALAFLVVMYVTRGFSAIRKT